MAQTARISTNSDAIIQELIIKTKKTKIEIIDEALELYRYHERMRILNEQYETLRSDQNAWAQELKEREEWEGTLMDGFTDE